MRLISGSCVFLAAKDKGTTLPQTTTSLQTAYLQHNAKGVSKLHRSVCISPNNDLINERIGCKLSTCICAQQVISYFHVAIVNVCLFTIPNSRKQQCTNGSAKQRYAANLEIAAIAQHTTGTVACCISTYHHCAHSRHGDDSRTYRQSLQSMTQTHFSVAPYRAVHAVHTRLQYSTLWFKNNAPILADYNYDPVQSILIIFSKLFVNDHKSCLVVKFFTSPHICCHYTL